MQLSTKKMPITVKVTATLNSEEVINRKKIVYDNKKNNLILPGFRKGSVPQNIAEQKMNIEELYRELIDDFYLEVSKQYEHVSAKDFVFYGDLKKNENLTMEFIVELKPEVKLFDIEQIKNEKKFLAKDILISDEDIQNKINLDLKQEEKIIDSDKKNLENFDVAIIDFEGTVEGEKKPFNGGIAKGYQIVVNELNNGQKNFIDNFEDQMIGMKINEEKIINVKFPEEYRDKTLANKKANFKVKLNKIKQKVVSLLNEEFVITKGFKNIEEYKQNIKESLFKQKNNKMIEDLKKEIVCELINKSEISIIPEIMIQNELDKEWFALIRKFGKTEDQLLSEHNLSKEFFCQNTKQKSIEIVKASLVLEQIIKDNNLFVNNDEILRYVYNIANILQYDQDKKEKIQKDLETNEQQFNIMKKAALNEKAINFIYDYMQSDSSK
jgi:trigger factor